MNRKKIKYALAMNFLLKMPDAMQSQVWLSKVKKFHKYGFFIHGGIMYELEGPLCLEDDGTCNDYFEDCKYCQMVLV